MGFYKLYIKMKNIKQLEKEIEKMNKTSSLKRFIFTRVDGVDYVSKDVNEILELKAKLETLQEVCKEIDKQIDNYKKLNKKFPKNQTFVDMWTSLFALELKLQGEENV